MTGRLTTGSRRDNLASGFITFAGVLMIMTGSLQALMGIGGVAQEEFHVSTRNYIIELDATTWEWVHLLLGLAVVVGGVAVLMGQAWGRVVAIVLAIGSALANFAFIPHHPSWSFLIMSLDVFVWAFAAHGRDFELEAAH